MCSDDEREQHFDSYFNLLSKKIQLFQLGWCVSADPFQLE